MAAMRSGFGLPENSPVVKVMACEITTARSGNNGSVRSGGFQQLTRVLQSLRWEFHFGKRRKETSSSWRSLTHRQEPVPIFNDDEWRTSGPVCV